MTKSKPPADTSWIEMEGTPRQPRRDDDLPTWMVVAIVVLVAAVVVGSCVVSAAGLEAWQFFHHQNGLIGGQR